MSVCEMTNRSNMIEVKVRSIFSGKMLTPGRPVSRIVKIFTACPEVNRNREPKWGISNLANSIHGFSILYLVLLKAASSR